MKNILILLLFSCVWMNSQNCASQSRFDLVANYYPNQLPEEHLSEIVEYPHPIMSFNTLFISKFDEFLEIDSVHASLQYIILEFGKAKLDTIVIHPYTGDSITVFEDSIYGSTPILHFKDSRTGNYLFNPSFLICENKEHKYIMHVEEKSKNRLNYWLYYLPTCDEDKSKQENLIRYGEIKLLKGRKWPSISEFFNE